MLFIVRQNQSEDSDTSWLKMCELKGGGKEKTNSQDSGEAIFFFTVANLEFTASLLSLLRAVFICPLKHLSILYSCCFPGELYNRMCEIGVQQKKYGV